MSPGVTADVTVTAGELALYGSNGPLLALEAANGGAQAWASALIGGVVANAPSVGPDGTIYATSTASYLYALDAKTHAVAWEYPLASANGSAPTYFDGSVYVDGPVIGLVAIDAATGTARWTQPAVGGGCNVPIAADGTIYATSGTVLKAFDGAGNVRWSVDTGGTLGVCMLIDGAGSVLVVTGNQLAAYEPTQGHQLWAVPGGSGDCLFAIGADGKLFEATPDGHLLAFGN